MSAATHQGTRGLPKPARRKTRELKGGRGEGGGASEQELWGCGSGWSVGWAAGWLQGLHRGYGGFKGLPRVS